jgi:hypothetical protein
MGTSTAARPRHRPSRPTARALIGLLLALEIAFFVTSVGGGIADDELSTRLFWFVVSLLLLFGIHRRSRACWAVFLAFAVVAAAIVLVGAAGPGSFVPFAALGVQIAALLSPQVRAHVRGAAPAKDAAAVEPEDV